MADDFLTLADVADLLGMKIQTVSFYRAHSKPGRRYADHPFPTPSRLVGRSPIWMKDRVEELKAWDASRPGRGTGGGRPKKTEPRGNAAS